MDKNINKMSPAEIKLSELGFFLLEQDVIKISDDLSYPFIRYARFLEYDKTKYDMVITFDPSQYSIELWQEKRMFTTVFIDPTLLEAIQERAKELNF